MESVDDSRFRLIGSHLYSYVNVRKKAVNVMGEKVPYLERGAGIPIVLLHGFSCNKSNWRGVLNQLPSEDYRLIAPDVPGFCLSNFNPNLNYSGRFFIDWMDGFLDALGVDSCHLLSHSTSTMVGIYYSAERNERIKSLTLANMPDFFLPAAGEEGGIIDEFFESLKVNSGDEWYQSISSCNPPEKPKQL